MRAPEHSARHRTVARAALTLALAWALAGTAQAGVTAPAKAKSPEIVFPIVGPATYRDDFGDPRGSRTHAGNDLVSTWRAPVVAVEAGKVTIWTSSASAGCMLYLHAASGAEYLYIHLNNDLTADRDDRGGCKPGVAYAPGLRDGQRVRQGELIGYVGDSGDAAGLEYHLHFEYHPRGGDAVSPYRLLRRAEKLLFALPESELGRGAAGAATLTLAGKVRAVEPAEGEGEASGSGEGESTGPEPPPPPPSERRQQAVLLTVDVTSIRLSGGERFEVTRRVTLLLPADATLERARKNGAARLDDLVAGARVTVTTAPVEFSLETQRARPGTLSAARVVVRG
ncbi:MAG: M23 family metallopeptidase [Thermoleophilia bacterium]|nr:M23 family metallopeptidase [Thermoleophilia bacterium]